MVVPIYATAFSMFFVPYPTSHGDTPSQVRFRLPLDGPVTVAWGGAWPIGNYHAVYPSQCRAYDLLVSVEGKTFRGDGKKLEDYYCFGAAIVAPADGTVVSVADGHPNMPPGELGGSPAGGNQIVIEVAPREYLFLCHIQPNSITVKPGDRVTTGQLLGRVGNSGNTSEPHLHIHLQDAPGDDHGEGIPLLFHNFRIGDKLVERAMPTGGIEPQIVEHVTN
jgi:murein DD-endopeptidase MepM/ murein hydrolase activator NlpD